MSRKVKGIPKKCGVPGSTRTGYRNTWDLGKAAEYKKRWRAGGVNRPST
ncbi:MAG TPA: hypothetical protein GXZ25_00325 [Peptococcaceae bacterium]|jgi:hypothetical protein|nr:hypothetical protein [Bacillota bacterium]HHU85242.1 hypothetical protein [Peptococcaceae bacterium]